MGTSPQPYIASRPKRTETRLVFDGYACLSQFATEVEREYQIGDCPMNYRVDLKGVLANGHRALVEVKAFNENLAPYAEAIIQAASYADAIKYPVFVGPVVGSVSDIVSGRMDNALGAFHAMASRLNVGFLYVHPWGGAGLLLRGRRIVDSGGVVENKFAQVWYYAERHGSKQVRS